MLFGATQADWRYVKMFGAQMDIR
ncbi:protein of unknown function (plasmid) [Caballeronia sp. S22]